VKTKILRNRTRGFTLVEILIGTAIVLFMVAMLGQILSSTQSIWRSSESRTDPFRDSRAALELMSRQLSLATMTIPATSSKAPVLALRNIYSQGGSDPDGPAHNQQVYVLAPISNSSKSDICAVGFYCSWNSAKHAYILRRHFLDSDATFAQLTKAGLPVGAGPIAADKIFLPTNPLQPPNQDEDLAAYVWDLKIVPYEYSGGVLNPNTNYPIEYNTSLPQYIEISFKAMSPQTANKLTAEGVGTDVWFDTNNPVYKNQILPQLHQFDTRVRIYNATGP